MKTKIVNINKKETLRMMQALNTLKNRWIHLDMWHTEDEKIYTKIYNIFEDMLNNKYNVKLIKKGS